VPVVVISALVVSLLGHWQVEGLVLDIGRIVIWFYVVEVLLARVRNHQRLRAFACAGFLTIGLGAVL